MANSNIEHIHTQKKKTFNRFPKKGDDNNNNRKIENYIDKVRMTIVMSNAHAERKNEWKK